MKARSSLPVAILGACTSGSGRIDEHEARIKELEAKVRSLEERTAPPSSASTGAASDVESCAQARVRAHDAWEKTEPNARAAVTAANAHWIATQETSRKALETARVGETNANFMQAEADNSQAVVRLKQSEGQLKQIIAAKTSSGEGALKFHDAARAVRDDSNNPNIALAKQSTETAFELCKTIAP